MSTSTLLPNVVREIFKTSFGLIISEYLRLSVAFSRYSILNVENFSNSNTFTNCITVGHTYLIVSILLHLKNVTEKVS